MTRYRGKKGHREVHPKIFIFSHTTKAEIEYFQDFKNQLRTPLLMPKKYICGSPQELIKKVVKWKKENICEKDNDQVWCIFDVDNFYKNSKTALMKLINTAIKNNVKIAYANECFELWILLHFPAVTTAIQRGKSIENKIQNAFTKNRLGNFRKNQKIFDTLLSFQNNAIKYSNNILPNYKQINWEIRLSEQGNPSTSIHFLVEEINMIIRKSENSIL